MQGTHTAQPQEGIHLHPAADPHLAAALLLDVVPAGADEDLVYLHLLGEQPRAQVGEGIFQQVDSITGNGVAAAEDNFPSLQFEKSFKTLHPRVHLQQVALKEVSVDLRVEVGLVPHELAELLEADLTVRGEDRVLGEAAPDLLGLGRAQLQLPISQQVAQEVEPLRHLRRVDVAPVRAELRGVHLGHGLTAGADGRHVGGEVVVVRDLDDEGVALLLPVDDLAPVDADAGCEPLPLMTVEYDMNINQTST